MMNNVIDVDDLRENAIGLFVDVINSLSTSDAASDDDPVILSTVLDLWDDVQLDGDTVSDGLVVHGNGIDGSEGTWRAAGWSLEDLVGYMLGSEKVADQAEQFNLEPVDPSDYDDLA